MERSAVLKSRRKAAEQLDGVRVGEAPGLGKVLFATRDFDVGDIALLEMPLLVFTGNKQLVKGYLRLNEEDKAKIFDMRPLLEAPRYKQCQEYALKGLEGVAELHEQFKNAISKSELVGLVSVSIFNAYAYDMAGQIYSELDVGVKPQVAIFYLGSKIAPSCDPNILYTSSIKAGFGAFVVLKPIAAGEMLTMCSVDGSHSTVERRGRMLTTKDYFCECPRCVGPDRVSGMRCEQPGCTGVKYGYHRGPNDNRLRDWQCDKCQHTGSPDMAILERYQRSLRAFLRTMLDGSASIASVAHDLEELAVELERALSPTHFLLIELYDGIRLPVRHHAIVMQDRGTQRRSELYRVRGAEYGVKLMKLMECVSANCTKGLSCDEQHPPSMTDPVPLLWIGMDLLRTSLKSREQYFPFLERYMPYLFSAYGHDDDDITAVEAMLQEWRERGGNAVAAVTASASSRAEPDAAVEKLAEAMDDWLVDTPVAARRSTTGGGNKKKGKTKRRGRK